MAIRIIAIAVLMSACTRDAPPPPDSTDSSVVTAPTQYGGHPPQSDLAPGDQAIGSALIGVPRFDASGNPIADTAFALEHRLRAGRHVLRLQRVAHGARLSEQYTETIAELDIGPLPENEELHYQHCRVEGVHDPEIVAIAVPDTAPYFTTLRRAWRASRTTRAFEEVALYGIDCENLGYGI